MKIKTKLIATIMSICLVCAVFAIGVFALKTANLKIGGDVSFSATGVEATVTNANITGMKDSTANADFKMAANEELTIDTSMTQGDIDGKFADWQGLDLTFNDAAEDIVLTFDIINDSTNADNYIEIDYNYSFSGDSANVDVFPGINNNYILAPNASTATTFTLIVRVINKELTVGESSLSVTIELNHSAAALLSVDNSNYYYEDVKYNLSKSTTPYTAAIETYRNSPTNLVIPAVVKYDGIYYIVNELIIGSFYESKLVSIELPNSIVYIGSFALGGIDTLTSVEIPKSVIFDDMSANSQFQNSGALNNIIMHNNVTHLTFTMFGGCSSLTTFKIPNSVVYIPAATFMDAGVTSLVIPYNVTYINFNMLGTNNTIIQEVRFVNQEGWTANGEIIDVSDPVKNLDYFNGEDDLERA